MVLVVEGHPFDGVDDHYELAYRASLNAATQDVFVVGQKRRNTGSYSDLISSRAIPDEPKGYIPYGGNFDYKTLFGADKIQWASNQSTNAYISDVPQLFDGSINGPNSEYFVDGMSMGTQTSYTVNTNGAFRVGAGDWETPAGYLDGDIGEVIIFNANLTTKQRRPPPSARQQVGPRHGLHHLLCL